MANLEKAPDVGEKQTTPNSILHADVYGAIGDAPQKPSPDAGRKETDAEVKAGTLPAVSLGNSADKHWWSGSLTVAEDLGKGALNEVMHHPLHLVESAAVGAVVGLGVAVASPEVAIGAALLGTGYAAYKIYEDGGKWLDAAGTVANEKGHTAQEIANAHATVQGLGAGATDIVAGALGGAAGSFAGNNLALALRPSPEIAPVVPASSTPVTSTSMEVAAPALPATPTVDNSSYASPSIYNRTAETSFTPEQTTIQLANPELWNSLVATNGKSEYGVAILNFANRWATTMEAKIAAGEPLSKPMIMAAADKADTDGISGAMASQAENLLSQTWKYGADFIKIVDARS